MKKMQVMVPSSRTTSARLWKGRGQSRGSSAVKYRLMTCNEYALSVYTKKYPELTVRSNGLRFLWEMEMFNKTEGEEPQKLQQQSYDRTSFA